jgi:hypothetical protein
MRVRVDQLAARLGVAPNETAARAALVADEDAADAAIRLRYFPELATEEQRSAADQRVEASLGAPDEAHDAWTRVMNGGSGGYVGSL